MVPTYALLLSLEGDETGPAEVLEDENRHTCCEGFCNLEAHLKACLADGNYDVDHNSIVSVYQQVGTIKLRKELAFDITMGTGQKLHGVVD